MQITSNIFRILTATMLLYSCTNRIETNETLPAKDIKRIQELKLLDSGEKICRFYSEYKPAVAGNFFTNERMASYWTDPNDSLKNKISAAFYKDIISIDTVYYAGATYCPFMLVTKKDSSNFKVCVNGSRQEITGFFTEALNLWKLHKSKY